MHAMNLNANAKCIAHTILIKTRLRLLNAMPRRKKNKAADQRQNYWDRHPEESGYTSQPKSSSGLWPDIKQPTYRNTHRSNANPSRTSRTPRVGEATLSGHDSTTKRSSGERSHAQQKTAPSASGAIPRQGRPSASGTIPRQNRPSASGTIPRQDRPSVSGAMPQQNTKDAYRNASPTRRSASQKRDARAARTDTAKYPANAASRIPESSDFGAERYLSAQRTRRKPSGSLRNKLIAGAVAVAVVAIGIFAFTTWDANKAVSVTINGQQQTIEGQQRTIEGLLDTNTVSVTPETMLLLTDRSCAKAKVRALLLPSTVKVPKIFPPA